MEISVSLVPFGSLYVKLYSLYLWDFYIYSVGTFGMI